MVFWFYGFERDRSVWLAFHISYLRHEAMGCLWDYLHLAPNGALSGMGLPGGGRSAAVPVGGFLARPCGHAHTGRYGKPYPLP
jgi:hypothetical protein